MRIGVCFRQIGVDALVLGSRWSAEINLSEVALEAFPSDLLVRSLGEILRGLEAPQQTAGALQSESKPAGGRDSAAPRMTLDRRVDLIIELEGHDLAHWLSSES
jgi:hypothetical protein